MTSLPRSLPQIPRYTSYPTAPHFNQQNARKAQSLLFSSVTRDQPVSVYVHIPFCDRLCWFCGCHTKHTLKYQPVADYVQTLVQEIEQFAERIPVRPKLGSLHFGGGSPSMLKPREASILRQVLENVFDFLPDTEISVEVDPNDACADMMDALRILGMTRASLGVQDFNKRVQDAINRPQSFEETRELVDALRDGGVHSLNIDALYGLPFQTCETLDTTIDQVLSLKPDRIALFGYAHVPSIKKHQNMIDESHLPDDKARVEQALLARGKIVNAGFETIGLDHFARPGDALAIAARAGKLRRNFQGYTTDNAPLLLGFGASSISSSNGAYLQNTVATGHYKRLVSEGKSVAERGLVLSRDDQVRAFMIQALMCNFRLDTREIETEFPDIGSGYTKEVEVAFNSDPYGLCTYQDGVLEVVPDKRDYVRLAASWFDAYLESGKSRYSKAV